MSEIDNGGPAFPVEVDNEQPYGFQTGNTRWQSYGMSLRDYFAAKAMQGVLASCTNGQEVTPSICAPWCYEIADAMLKAREAK